MVLPPLELFSLRRELPGCRAVLSVLGAGKPAFSLLQASSSLPDANRPTAARGPVVFWGERPCSQCLGSFLGAGAACCCGAGRACCCGAGRACCCGAGRACCWGAGRACCCGAGRACCCGAGRDCCCGAGRACCCGAGRACCCGAGRDSCRGADRKSVV